jgi:hypothetical protein
MRHLLIVAALLFVCSTASAQWTPFFDGAVFGTYASQAGPAEPEHRTISTNWFELGVQRQYTSGRILAGARFSLEPLTVPEDGYPQLFQYISPESGGPLVDRMRAHDLVQEIAVAAEWKMLRLYLAPVGEPAIGATPHFLRDSGVDYAEAPFSFDVLEADHVATRVVTAGVGTKTILFEGGVFHNARSTGRHTTIDDGDIDSWGARITFAPQGKISAQVSAGRLGEEKVELTTASLTYNNKRISSTLLWGERDSLQSYGLENAVRFGRNTFLGRVEWIDRPGNVFTPERKRMSHLTVGYIFDFIQGSGRRVGAGFNVDYHTGTRHLVHDYGHKPQGLFAFIRFRTDRATRPVSL